MRIPSSALPSNLLHPPALEDLLDPYSPSSVHVDIERGGIVAVEPLPSRSSFDGRVDRWEGQVPQSELAQWSGTTWTWEGPYASEDDDGSAGSRCWRRGDA